MQRGKTATGGYRNIGGEVGESVDLVGGVECWNKERERERDLEEYSTSSKIFPIIRK